MSTSGTLPSHFNPRVAGLVSQGVAPTRPRLILRDAQDAAFRSTKGQLVASEFKKHKKKWLSETMYYSSPVDRYLHESYARIIGLGWPAVPHILRSLAETPNDWFYALRAITGENPVSDSMAGDVVQMAQAWVAWGKARGLI
ncbi:hypothetical protein [Bradyrhizobium sp. CB2312]|uniref:hypothetical protein n=1 Tax=Bradyrhizobium sp. CB2312 TaxID=3039155 RepID=UPI0024B05E7E|nr:hypothetical protein [Bradyrhizobium sp. CB2312]WFU68583.1 hypothetical protein QA642_24975 [Bradyrhizobium sp. CB2312]